MKKKIFDKKIKMDSTGGKMFTSVLTGLLVGIILSGLTSLMYVKTDIQFENLFSFSIFIYVISALAAGYTAGAKLKENGMVCGGLSGFFLFIICLIISFFMNIAYGLNLVYKMVICILSGAIGGIIEANKKQKKKIKSKK